MSSRIVFAVIVTSRRRRRRKSGTLAICTPTTPTRSVKKKKRGSSAIITTGTNPTSQQSNVGVLHIHTHTISRCLSCISLLLPPHNSTKLYIKKIRKIKTKIYTISIEIFHHPFIIRWNNKIDRLIAEIFRTCMSDIRPKNLKYFPSCFVFFLFFVQKMSLYNIENIKAI